MGSGPFRTLLLLDLLGLNFLFLGVDLLAVFKSCSDTASSIRLIKIGCTTAISPLLRALSLSGFNANNPIQNRRMNVLWTLRTIFLLQTLRICQDWESPLIFLESRVMREWAKLEVLVLLFLWLIPVATSQYYTSLTICRVALKHKAAGPRTSRRSLKIHPKNVDCDMC